MKLIYNTVGGMVDVFTIGNWYIGCNQSDYRLIVLGGEQFADHKQ